VAGRERDSGPVVNRFWRAATLIWMAGILVVSLLPGGAATPGGTGWHLAGYAILGVLWGRWQPGWLVWLLATGYGAAIEGLQLLVPGRLAEAPDILANALGVLAGLLLARLLSRSQTS